MPEKIEELCKRNELISLMQNVYFLAGETNEEFISDCIVETLTTWENNMQLAIECFRELKVYLKSTTREEAQLDKPIKIANSYSRKGHNLFGDSSSVIE